jgi:hypothetical protein
MIPYQDLCAALDSYVARANGGAGTAPTVRLKPVEAASSEDATGAAEPTGDVSQEIDLGDVVAEEEV